MIKVFIKHPERLGYTAVIKNELKEMQELVGGYIETVMFTDNLIIVCNEEGRLIPLPKNFSSPSKPSFLGFAPVAIITVFACISPSVV